MKNISQLKKNLKNDFSHLKTVRVALLGDTATQFLNQALRGTGYDYGFDLQLLEADFNQVERQIFDPASELYEFKPDIVIVFHAAHKLLGSYNKLKPEACSSLAVERIALVENICTTLNANINCKIIYYNYTEIEDAVFGNYANQVNHLFYFSFENLILS